MAAETFDGLDVLFFPSAEALHRWLSAAPRDLPGIWLKLAKKTAGVASVAKAEAVDAGLCHGWIDGQQRPYDDAFWLTRFTPRRRKSRWSEVNRTRAEQLMAEGRVSAAGRAEIDAARADGRWDAAYAPASTAAPCPVLRAALDGSPVAAEAFARLRAAERYSILYRLANLKTEESRARRVAAIVASFEEAAFPQGAG